MTSPRPHSCSWPVGSSSVQDVLPRSLTSIRDDGGYAGQGDPPVERGASVGGVLDRPEPAHRERLFGRVAPSGPYWWFVMRPPPWLDRSGSIAVARSQAPEAPESVPRFGRTVVTGWSIMDRISTPPRSGAYTVYMLVIY